ncbi:MAG: hypothetical protein J1F32_03710 [Erysipelotrichales bacterium]|nr:hypothetical protein [Erysipelotrichales bacterium]
MNNFAVLICGYDGYKEIWKTNAFLFDKFWSDCPYNVYFSTEYSEAPTNKFITIKCGKYKTWCERAVYALNQIQEKYVLILMDDFFLVRKPNVKHINTILSFMEKEDAFCVRLSPHPRAKHSNLVVNGVKMGEIDYKKPYSISLQASIWNKYKIVEIFKNYESAWYVEILGSRNYPKGERTFVLDHKFAKEVYCDIGDEGAIQGGKWTRKMYRFAKKNKIELSNKILVEPSHTYLWKRCKKTVLKPLLNLLKNNEKIYSKYRDKRYGKTQKNSGKQCENDGSNNKK